MKIFFVGVHNKPGLTALHSSTISGKRIDVIIERIQTPSIKTNLFDCDYLPQEAVVKDLHRQYWSIKHKPEIGDVIVLLGKTVHKEFPLVPGCKIVKVSHPALRNPCIPAQYIESVVRKLKSIITASKFVTQL